MYVAIVIIKLCRTAEYKVVHYALLALFMRCMTVAFEVSLYISYCSY